MSYSSEEVANLCRARTVAVEELAKAKDVLDLAQSILTALNVVGDIKSGSKIHIKLRKLREVMIAYREARERSEAEAVSPSRLCAGEK